MNASVFSLVRDCTTQAFPSPDGHPADVGLEAEACLRRTSYLALRDVSCLACDQVVMIRGRLPNQYLKQLAQAIVSEIAGTRRVINHIQVAAAGHEQKKTSDDYSPASEASCLDAPSKPD
ncbi:BON domain-containing protein [Singulisphaera sp. PoT]|uniref:BON domain-containing protein n=1 Tax=Singulisphaera sp. PoT TaxID=3411797 RepID=UPI003BF4DA04